MIRKLLPCLAAAVFSLILFHMKSMTAYAGQATPLNALAKLPIREVTVFKDGHAFLMHEGRMPTDPSGNVILDYLPTPVLGTFWAYSGEKGGRLAAVVASQHKVRIQRTALTIRELIEGNIGARVVVTELPTGRETTPLSYQARIIDVPQRTGEELDKTDLPSLGGKLPQKGNVVLLETESGIKATSIERIVDVTFASPPKRESSSEEFRNLLTLKLDWQSRRAAPEAAVGMSYLQKGLRWIPEYKITLDGSGNAAVQLQATLINELADMEDVTAHLVVGVPAFAFKDMVDPIALQQTLARLSPYFEPNSTSRLSNSIMTQVAAPAVADERNNSLREPSGDFGPEITASQKNEDLFIYTVQHVTLKKGQRLVLPVNEAAIQYGDIFTLEIPFALPAEIRREELRANDEQLRELTRLAREPKVMHKIRLSNKSGFPLTTAPALILRDGRVLAQTLISHTPVGAQYDLPITQAVDISLKKDDKEIRRVPNADTWQGRQYGRIDLAGTLVLTNHRGQPADLEIVRYVLGSATEAGSGGKIERINLLENGAAGELPVPAWLWYSWPDWWSHFNSVGKIAWKITLGTGQSANLTYAWNYFWR
jgi:hypothetical protein